MRERRPVGPSYKSIGGDVVPKVTTPPPILFGVRLRVGVVDALYGHGQAVIPYGLMVVGN